MAEVRMREQVSGTRDGKAWPAPGQTVDIDDDTDRQALIDSGVAEDPGVEAGTVSVPITGVHVPGDTGRLPTREVLAEVPADAVMYPERVPDEAKDRVEPPLDRALQHKSGRAMSTEQADQAISRSEAEVQKAAEHLPEGIKPEQASPVTKAKAQADAAEAGKPTQTKPSK